MDNEGLSTLDVLMVGNMFQVSPSAARSIRLAVESGTGLLNEGWSGAATRCPTEPNWPTNFSDDLAAITLSEGPGYSYHHGPRCGGSILARVRNEHCLLPGLRAGDRLYVSACGPVLPLLPAAQVLIEKQILIARDLHQIPSRGDARMPAFTVGSLGRGRVILSSLGLLRELVLRIDTPTTFMLDLLNWLAMPRRQ